MKKHLLLLSRITKGTIILFFFFGLSVQLRAQNATGLKPDYFSPKFENLQSIPIGQMFSGTTSESQSIKPFENSPKIYGLALSADIELKNNGGLVRVVLIDVYSNEHLVYEAYPSITDNKSFTVTNICEETCILNGVAPASLQIQTLNSSISIKNIAVSYTAPQFKNEFAPLKQQTLDAQNDAKIEIINKNNSIKGVDWVAGKTDISHLSYMEKKMLINGGHILNLQGFEYYKGGVFVYDMGYGDSAPEAKNAASMALVDRWDWRERHGANKVGSPYYDGDVKKGGWFTAIKTQKCNQCWCFAPTATIEVLTNLYFNQHIDLDLSEQQLSACAGGAGGSCEGGTSSATANYIANSGIVSESCMPYKASDGIACSTVCTSPVDKIKAASRVSLGSPDEATMKKYIMDYGPVSSGVNGMWHFMCLQGFYKDAAGSNVWIFKNSYGPSSGDNGFANIKITGSGQYDKLYGNYAFKTPLTSAKQYSIACNDKDGDGYYNWGIGKTKPATCVTCPNEEDADDSDPCIGPLDANYNGTSITFSISSQPASQTAKAGDVVSFSVTATGGISFKYQWKKNGTDIAGATNSTLTLNKVSAADDGSYQCMISSPCNSLTSNTATLKVDGTTDVYELAKNNADLNVFPNPANKLTMLSYFLPSKVVVKLSVVNMLGEEIIVLLDNKEQERGLHTASLNTTNLKPGVYFCKLSFSNYSFGQKIIVLKSE
jgi:hypothetical protein